MTNSQRGFAPILIILLLIAGATVAGGGYYVVAKHSEAKKAKVANVVATSKSLEPTASAVLTPAPSASVTAKPKASPSPSVTYYGAEITPMAGDQGWPIKIKASIPIKGRIQTYTGMMTVTAVPVTSATGQFTLIISGFPANTDLHVYTNGYREHEVKRSNSAGALIFDLPSNLGGEFIIKDTPS